MLKQVYLFDSEYQVQNKLYTYYFFYNDKSQNVNVHVVVTFCSTWKIKLPK